MAVTFSQTRDGRFQVPVPSRQSQIDLAFRQFALAKTEQSRQYWRKKIEEIA